MRSRDTLARVGGDEFAALLEHCPADQALRIAEELRDSVRSAHFVWEGRQFPVGVSIGIVPLTPEIESASAALNAADGACYLAKRDGGNAVRLCDVITNPVGSD